jgi:enoyl-CoA hydratase/carnithine racemase
MSEYFLLDILRDGQVATIQLKRIEKHLREKLAGGKAGGAQRASEVGRALNELRDDNSVRVIVITGKEDVFTAIPAATGTS